MRFYAIQPSELEALEDVQKLGLHCLIPSIRAAESLVAQRDLAAATLDDHQRRDVQAALAREAYGHDPRTLAVAMESITRRG
jgi:hypothetical protein